MRKTIAKIDPRNPTRGLLGLMDAADARVGELQRRLAGWFDAGMMESPAGTSGRSSGFLLALATVVTLAVNANTIRIAEQLWRRPQRKQRPPRET